MPANSRLTLGTLLQQRAVQIALAVVAVILVGSIAYYLIESAPPTVTAATVTPGNITEDLTETGTVSPVQNPTLAFEVGGKVTQVNATVGEKISAGTLLATLDTGVLSANLSAAQAKLNELEAGPRAVDLAGQQTAVSNSQQALSNTITNYPQTLSTTLSKAEEAVYTDADPLFNTSTANDPSLIFTTTNFTNKVTADGERADLTVSFAAWQSELNNAGANPSTDELQSLTSDSLTRLTAIRTFFDDLDVALNDAQLNGNFSQAQKTAALAEVNTGRDTVNDLITSLTSTEQSITSQQLAVQSATDQLNQTSAGATTQDIQAQQASVQAIEAQISQQEIVAPFSGTVASVSTKAGDVISANSPAITLVPDGTFEVPVYLAENDVTQVKVGQPADITLDAYGASRIFPAIVATVESSPSINPNSNGGTQGGYKVTLVFTNADPAIANGMHANVVIHAGSAQNVLLVPKSAVIIDGTNDYVLKQSGKAYVKTPVTIGLEGTDSVEVLSGLSAGDTVSAVGAQ